MTTLRERAKAAYDAREVEYAERRRKENLEFRYQLAVRIEKILGVTIPVPDSDRVTIEGLIFSLNHASESLTGYAACKECGKPTGTQYQVSSIADVGGLMDDSHPVCRHAGIIFPSSAPARRKD